MKLLLIGGTRFVGRHLVDVALAAEHDWLIRPGLIVGLGDPTGRSAWWLARVPRVDAGEPPWMETP